MSDIQLGELAALVVAFLWTLSSLAWTAAGKQIGALAVSFIRLVIAAIFLMLYCRMTLGHWWPAGASGRTWLLMGSSGICGFFLCDLFLFKALLLIGPRLALLIFSLTPPMAAILSALTIGDVLTVWHWGAMGVTLFGVVWVVLERPAAEEERHEHWGRGIALAVAAAAVNAAGLVLSKEGIGNFDAAAATLIRAIVALPCYVVLVSLWRRWPTIVAAFRWPRAIGILTFGAFVGPFVGVALNLVALRHAPTGVVATIVATMPVMVLPWSIFLHHERVSLRAVVGAVVAIVGVAMLVLR